MMSDQPAPLSPARTAIIAMDFQDAILKAFLEPTLLVARVERAIMAVREAGGAVGYVRVAFEPGEISRFPAHSAMGQRMKLAGTSFMDDSPATAVNLAIAPRSGDIIVRKTRVGAFSTTDLHDQLQQRGIDTLILAGIHTSGVVLSTVRDAHDRDYRIIVLSDCCDDPDPVVHEFLIGTIFPRQAEVMRVDQMKDILMRKADTHA